MEMTFQNSHNPLLLPQFHVPDGEAHVMPDGKLYIYGSYDDCELAYCSDFYRVISTPDMKTWTVHQKAMEGAAVPWFREDMAGQVYGTDEAPDTPFIRMMNAAIADDPDKDYFGNLVERERTALLYAPDGAHKDGKYYLYFCMEDGSEGVGISDRPEGPFGDFRQLPAQGIDPAILVDDDGNAYYFWGQFSARGVKLNPDMVSYDPAQVKKDIVTEEEHFFHEGFSIRRIGDTYYAVFSEISRGKPTALGYATAKHPLGPYTYRGVIVDNDGCDPESWNNHGSIECFRGQWYVFYHRSTRGCKIHRRLCAEKIEILPDGTIPEVKMTSQGPGNAFALGEMIYGWQACGLKGQCRIDTDPVRGKDCVTQIANGDRVFFRYADIKDIPLCVQVDASGKAEVELWIDDAFAGFSSIDPVNARIPLLPQENGQKEVELRFKNPENLSLFGLCFIPNKE